MIAANRCYSTVDELVTRALDWIDDLSADDVLRYSGLTSCKFDWLLPLVKPSLAALAMFSFLHHWNDFSHQVIYLNSRANFTLPLAVSFLRRAQGGTDASTDISLVMTASLPVMLPPLLLFFFARRYFIQSVVFTGIKG